MNAIVRPYEHRDREAVRYVCCETGLMGEPMEVFIEGREVFADMWSRYYTDYEPEHCWVAQVEGRVVGYLLGALDTNRQEHITRDKILPELARKAFTTRCVWSLKTVRCVRRGVRSIMRGEFRVPRLGRDYPAHLHTNLLDGYRGMGLGTQLMKNWLEHLASHGVSGVHLVTTTYNKQAVPFYRHMGFEDIFENPLTFYEDIIAEPVALLGMGLKLYVSEGEPLKKAQ